ncbi:hypothetical protein LZC95_31880 [Pendulispora brunnea]|uniref:Uncharacterized protein n=1 Tax=Pendulispora brunnea TaxID=2905690 RepID=A0ABZ2K3V2_9BACT
MKSKWYLAFVPLVLGMGCSDGFGELKSNERLTVTLVNGERGTKLARVPIALADPARLTVKVEAYRADGSPNTDFTGYVRLSIKPGTVKDLAGPNVVGRNVRLINGVADDVTLGVVGSYGDTRIWAEDMGYFPVDPNVDPPPQCSDGKDNDGDGDIDFPADPGCAFANDDSEDGGTLATGVSPILYFAYPRVRDVRGVSQGGSATSFPHEQVQIDTGYRPEDNSFEFSLVVTRIATDGFYVTDLNPKDFGQGFHSLFAFNFSAPARLGVCDRLTALAGTASDFFGFTELGFPTWGVETWDQDAWLNKLPGARPCMVPEPFVFSAKTASPDDTNTKFQQIAALVRAWTGDVPAPEESTEPKTHAHTLTVASHFGSGFPKAPSYAPKDDASNCDLNGDGSVDFNTNPEKACAAACDKDVQCSEWSTYAARGDFRLVLHDGDTRIPAGTTRDAKIQANASTVSAFNAAEMRGKPIKSFTGTLRYFSGGSQFTIEARCPDDIVVGLDKRALRSDEACLARTTSENPGN